MQIAVIGWGSLIWDPRELAMQSRWHKDGPWLPIEFARMSANGRLTLVTHVGSVEQRTYWLRSGLETLAAARDNLRMREGSPCLGDIHWACLADVHDAADLIAGRVQSWLSEQAGLDAAIWTGLDATIGGDIVATAVAYLTSLVPGAPSYQRAREYLVNAPPQIQTQVRREMRSRSWTDAPLSDDLFERTTGTDQPPSRK